MPGRKQTSSSATRGLPPGAEGLDRVEVFIRGLASPTVPTPGRNKVQSCALPANKLLIYNHLRVAPFLTPKVA